MNFYKRYIHGPASITRDEMEKLCPGCAAKMKSLGMRELRLDQMNEKAMEGLCEKFGEGEGFRTRCMDSNIPLDDLGAFCNWLKIQCHGSATAGDK